MKNAAGKQAPFAKKSFGQNFLVDDGIVSRIVGALDPRPGELIVEIGPGRGALTEKLLAAGARVAAVELEREMIEVLKGRFSGSPDFALIAADALKVNFAEIVEENGTDENGAPVRLVANLPYYISTAILQKLIAERAVFGEMILMFQREVVDRITAPPGDSERGFLTVLTEAYLKTGKLFEVPPSAFRPAPKVWSAVVRLIPRETAPDPEAEKLFRTLASVGFARKRKTILNNFRALPPEITDKFGSAREILDRAGLDPARRAETLTRDEWINLLEIIAASAR
ncbi:MAG: ribosomal RNA small subunit methyltransferase A [Acidobacteria bacterium]|nr:ribosomal RNA small subunit methyltransferase A [Acidobacteriota bacterium]